MQWAPHHRAPFPGETEGHTIVKQCAGGCFPTMTVRQEGKRIPEIVPVGRRDTWYSDTTANTGCFTYATSVLNNSRKTGIIMIPILQMSRWRHGNITQQWKGPARIEPQQSSLLRSCTWGNQKGVNWWGVGWAHLWVWWSKWTPLRLKWQETPAGSSRSSDGEDSSVHTWSRKQASVTVYGGWR